MSANFGRPSIFTSGELAWSGGEATAVFQFPTDRQFAVFAISTSGAASNQGNACLVKKLYDTRQGIEHVKLAAATAALPLAQIAAIGTAQTFGPRWHGNFAQSLKLFRECAALTYPNAPAQQAHAVERAARSLQQRFGEHEPDVAFIRMNGFELQLELLALGGDEPTSIELWAIDLGVPCTDPCAPVNEPFWFAAGRQTLGTSAAAITFDQIYQFANNYVPVAGSMLAATAQGSLFAASDGDDLNAERYKVALGVQNSLGNEIFFASNIPLSAFGANPIPVIEAPVTPQYEAHWHGYQAAMSESTHLYLAVQAFIATDPG